MTLKSTDTMERITRQQLVDNFDEILERVNNESIGFVILDDEGKDGQVLCPAKWFETSTEAEDIPTAMRKLKQLKETAYELVENTIKKVEDGTIADKDALEDFQFMLMNYLNEKILHALLKMPKAAKSTIYAFIPCGISGTVQRNCLIPSMN